MTNPSLTHRLARRDDLDALRGLMDAAIAELQKPFLDAEQIAASRTFMGLDTQLVDDGTYFIIELDGSLAGCGGWSRRNTLYGGDETQGRNAELLDPSKDSARVRAMYTHPDFHPPGCRPVDPFALRGSGEGGRVPARRAHGDDVRRTLYRACGYEPLEEVMDDSGGVPVPLLRMTKPL